MAPMAVLLSLVASCLASVTYGSPMVEERAVCNADNCLRQIRRASLAASPYCSSYYTATVTTTKTITVPFYDATFPALKKRADPAITSMALEVELVKKTVAADPTPTFVSSCTGAATRISSACSCVLGSGAATSTATVTATFTLPLPAACQTSNGLFPTPLTIASLPAGQGASGLAFETLPGGCCAYCLASDNCIFYYEVLDYTPSDPAKVACGIVVLGAQPVEPLSGAPQCPLGIAQLSMGAPESTVLYGAGPCATVLPALPQTSAP